jgi:hypothetical protein
MDSEEHRRVGKTVSVEANGRHVILDLKALTLANQDAINFLDPKRAESRSRIAQHASVNGS